MACCLCECEDFSPHLFKAGLCKNCKHVHDPTKVKRTRRRKKSVGEKCEICAKTVYSTEKLEAINNTYHETCFACTRCSKRLTLITYKVHDEKPYCSTCFGRSDGAAKGFGKGKSGNFEAAYAERATKTGETQRASPSAAVRSASRRSFERRTSAEAASSAEAVKPGDTVVITHPSSKRKGEFAEVLRLGDKPGYWKIHFEDGDKVEYPETKFKKQAHTMIKKKSKKKANGGGHDCSRCGDRVYANEKVEALDKVFHNTCFKCRTCNKTLTLINYKVFNDDPYCQRCFSRTDGTAKGFGLGAAGNYPDK